MEVRGCSSESIASMSCGNLSYSGLFHRRPKATYCRSLLSRQRPPDSPYIQPPSPHLDLPLTPRKSLVSSAFVVALAVVLIVCYLPRRFAVPFHLLEQPVQVEGSYLSAVEASALRGLIRGGGPIHVRKGHVAEVAFSTAEEEHCCDSYAPGSSLCNCQLRTDVSHHYYRTGGPDGLKESTLSLWRRAQTFQVSFASPEAIEGQSAIRHLVGKKRTYALLASTCHADAQPVSTVTIDILLPGQVMPVELSVPPNRSANQSVLPPWLQSTMMFSGRFGDVFTPTAEITAFFHSGRDMEGGAVRLWQGHDGVALDVSPTPLAAIAMDSSRVVHTRSTLHAPGSVAPPLPPNRLLALHYDPSTQRWVVTADGTEVVATYREEALRFSVTMVSKCGSPAAPHFVDSSAVLDTLKQELIRRKVGHIEVEPQALQRQLTRTIVRYPLPPTDVPYNLCWQLEHLGDWASPFTRII
eukprot:GILJ01024979.1.p1 GENE.GILJ01024979.1~~GILJ01024979.1.p1  ORF type:complete len:494 (-),score=38.57 GILJ01024979.1:1-1404(-)